MKPTTSLESGGYAIATPVPPLFSTSTTQHAGAVEMSQTFPLLEVEFPLFEEATQTASRFLGVSMSFVGISAPDTFVLKSAIGLSQLGLMNPLARSRRLPLQDSLIAAVLTTRRSLILPEIAADSPYADSSLVKEYGIQAFLGVPLLTAEGTCLGALVVMDVKPAEFKPESIAFLELLARWSVSEYERHQLAIALSQAPTTAAGQSAPPTPTDNALLDTVRLTLMSQLTQDMRNPLTTITGMANMLSREIYGALTPKQREYTDIVHTSSQKLLEIANEVLELSSLDAHMQPLHPTSVDVDMVGQHVERMLVPFLEKKSQEIRLTVEPGSRLWTLDRDVVQQLLYHLLYSIIQLAGEGGTVQVHSAERQSSLNIMVKMTHPWLGDGLPQTVALLHQRLSTEHEETQLLTRLLARATGREVAVSDPQERASDFQTEPEIAQSRETLSLLLSRHLIERHGGTLTLLGTQDMGYRFSIMLPFLKAADSAESLWG